eukprot:8159529-Lingulodinium_polyedra.AAC.1
MAAASLLRRSRSSARAAWVARTLFHVSSVIHCFFLTALGADFSSLPASWMRLATAARCSSTVVSA